MQHLRVKLVSLKKAAAGSSFRSDVLALGRTMLEIASNNKNVDELRSYDPSLFLLVQWMLSDEAITMAEVLRHPYFMSPSERQTFAIAMGGGMIANYLQGAAHAAGIRAIREAIQPSLDECLTRELSRLFEQTRVAGAAAPPGSWAPAAAIASSLDTRAVQPRGASLVGGGGGGGAAVAGGGGGVAAATTTAAAVRTITAAATTTAAAAAAAASVGGGSAAGRTPAANGQNIAPPRIESNRNPASAAHANPLQLTADMRSYSSFADRVRVFRSMTTGPNAVSPSHQAVTILLAAPDAGLHLQTVLDIMRALPDYVLCCHDILVKALPMCAEHNDTALLRRLWGVGANGLRDSKLGWPGISNPGVHYCISKLVQAREHAPQGRGWAMLLSLLQAESGGGGARAPEGEWPALAAPRRGGL